MNRRAILAMLAALPVPPVQAQGRGTLPTVGWLVPGPSSLPAISTLEAVDEGMRRNGFIDGGNVRVVPRYAANVPARIPGLARELAGLGSRVIVTVGTTAVAAISATLPHMPIVLAGSIDPVAHGFARSLERPGGRITGIVVPGASFVAREIAVLREAVPAAGTVAVFLNATSASNDLFRGWLQAASTSASLKLHLREIATVADIAPAYAWAAAQSADAVLVVPDILFSTHCAVMARLATTHRLPTIGGDVTHARVGALAGVGPDYDVIVRDVWRYIARIVRGADPATLAIEERPTLRIVVNRRAAEAMGMTLPPTLLARADEVIE
ncbi:MAG TPA: ABC transporter substrate-binding protein [Vineibacter sp.]|nr:ABC transporter substrate-binding protein [Vineibacter sp.]